VNNPFATIVGVVGAVRDRGLRDELSPEFYASYLQVGTYSIQSALVIRARQAAALAKPVRSEIAAMNPDQPIPQIDLMEQVLRTSVGAERFNAGLLTALAVLALILAAAGIYGVISYSVAHRAEEIRIRMALGAGSWQVMRLVLRQGIIVALIGVLAGTVAAMFLTRLLTSLLYGVRPIDPLTFTSVGVLLFVVAFVACYLPARRAIRLDGSTALRQE
jgi:ABC-type antimicrobial peptide transport system permease subunit